MGLETFLTYLGICFGLSFFIGIERQFRRRIIGLRTTILVSVGAFLYVSMSFITNADDVTRIASQVVSGIGFLGAGVIIKDGLKVRGLTTAATLWCDAAIGVLCATGAIYQAIAGTVIILFSNIILRYVNVIINDKMKDRKQEEFYEIQLCCLNENVSDIKILLNSFIKNHHKAGAKLYNFNMVEDGKESIMNFKLCFARGIDGEFNKFIDEICSKYNPKSLQFNQIEGIQSEEEEEAL